MELLGLRKVGWIFAASNKEREYIMSTSEVKQMATLQVHGFLSVRQLCWCHDQGGECHGMFYIGLVLYQPQHQC